MTNNFNSLDKWRSYFRTANCDIFVIIEHAIMVAASDCPYDFRIKRDRITELLFCCKATKCFGCDRMELALPNTDCLTRSGDKSKSVVEAGGSKDTKESKMNSCSREDNEDHREMVMKMNQNSSFSYGDAEALTDEVEEEYQFHEEVLRIKEILDKNQQESDSLLFDSLRKLRLMTFNVETLKATEIGKSVNDLRKHHSKEIRNLAKALVEDWKVMVDFWVSSTASIAAAAEVVTESAKTSLVEDEEGLPSPPMDEGAFFATPSSMELSKFFDEMDDDGNLQQNDNFNIKRESMTKSSYTHKDSKAEQKRNVDAKLKRHPVCPNESAPDLTKSSLKLQPKSINDQKVHNVKKDHENGTFPKLLPRLEEPALCNDGSVGMKLEAAKRKLHERYQEAENAKKKRTIQVVELRDLPKQNPVHRNQYNKPVMHRKQWHNTKW